MGGFFSLLLILLDRHRDARCYEGDNMGQRFTAVISRRNIPSKIASKESETSFFFFFRIRECVYSVHTIIMIRSL